MRMTCYPEPVHITKMITATFLTLLDDVGCTADRSNDKFVSHHSIRTRRYGHLFRDLEYVSDSTWAAIKLLQGTRDPGVVEDWLKVCTLLQCMYRFRRRTDTHIELEDYEWQDAANLILELESVSATFVSNALLSPVKLPSTITSSTKPSALNTSTDVDDILEHRKLAVDIALGKAFLSLREWSEVSSLTPSLGEEGDQDLFFNANSSPSITCLGIYVKTYLYSNLYAYM
jgi:hypothetical protein